VPGIMEEVPVCDTVQETGDVAVHHLRCGDVRAMLFRLWIREECQSGLAGAVHVLTSIINVMLMTFILVTSSLTMLVATRAAKAGDKAAGIRWTFVTVGGGFLFALLHIREWSRLIGEGVRLFQNPWGSPMFGATFLCDHGSTPYPRDRRGHRPDGGCTRLQAGTVQLGRY